jgi:hypothetical protein
MVPAKSSRWMTPIASSSSGSSSDRPSELILDRWRFGH